MGKTSVGSLVGALSGGGVIYLAGADTPGPLTSSFANLNLAGLLLGIFIGLLASIAALMYLWTAAAMPLSAAKTLQLMTALLAVGAFGLGGTWLSSVLLVDLNWALVLPSYLTGLLLIFGSANVYPLFRLVVRVGQGL
jgi:hypothetical protein